MNALFYFVGNAIMSRTRQAPSGPRKASRPDTKTAKDKNFSELCISTRCHWLPTTNLIGISTNPRWLLRQSPNLLFQQCTQNIVFETKLSANLMRISKKIDEIPIFRMLLFSEKERSLLTSFIEKRPKFEQAKESFDEEELQLLNSQNYGEKIWYAKEQFLYLKIFFKGIQFN